MTSISAMLGLCKADFLHRTRKYSFIVTLLLTAYVAYYILPPAEKYLSSFAVHLNQYRGYYNSAWIATCESLVAAFMLSLCGFYLVRGSISRDISTKVGQIIATTPIKKWQYLMGKFFSNFVLLAFMAFIMNIVALVMQFIRAEEPTVNFLQLVSPFILIVLPCLIFVSALAVLLDTIKPLSKSLGNVLFMIFWVFALTTSLETTKTDNSLANAVCDITGFRIIQESFNTSLEAYSDYSGDLTLGLNESLHDKDAVVFSYTGISWTTEVVIERVIVIILSLIIVFLGTLFFNRFDVSENKKERRKVTQRKNTLTDSIIAMPRLNIRDLTKPLHRNNFLTTLISELKLMLKGTKWWWFATALIINLIGLFNGDQDANRLLLQFGFIWSLPLWSKMGTYENHYGTHQLVFSSQNVLRYQFFSIYLTGVLVTLINVWGILLRNLLSGQMDSVLYLFCAVLFVPALAFTAGCLVKKGILFEAFYILLWYIGPLSGAEYMDYIGISEASQAINTPLVYGIATLPLLAIALLLRKRQMTY